MPEEHQVNLQSTSSCLARSTHRQSQSRHTHLTWAASVLPKPAASERDGRSGKSPKEGGRAESRGAGREEQGPWDEAEGEKVAV